MKIYLIRHAETVHNVAKAWAGTTDSNLTNHGILQIDCLAQSFTSNNIHFDSVFASDLTRARLTAEGICRHQPTREDGALLTPTLTADLRERDFGSLEGTRWRKNISSTKNNTNASSDAPSEQVEIESSVSMKRRATSFLNSHILPLLFENSHARDTIAIVSHGVILRVIWSCLVELFDPINISIEPGIYTRHEGPASQLVPSWSNTGYMSLSIHSHALPPPLPPRPGSPSQITSNTSQEQSGTNMPPQLETASNALLHGWSMKILAVNNKEHLSSLRRAGGGIGSASHDTRQKTIDHFFG